jgi:hypothetical protein
VARRERWQWRDASDGKRATAVARATEREMKRAHRREVAKNVEMNGYVGGETVSGFNILIIRASNCSDEVGKTGEEIAYEM